MAGSPLVLVTCDDPERQVVYQQTLGQAGYTVQSTDNPTLALQAIDRLEVAAVLVDLEYRPLQGFFLVGQVRDRAYDRKIPVVLVTDPERAGDMIRGLQAGASDCVPRNSPASEMVRALQRHVKIDEAPSVAAAPPPPPPASGPSDDGARQVPAAPAAAAAPAWTAIDPQPQLMPNVLEGALRDHVLAGILRQMQEGLVVLNVNYQIDYINPKACALLELGERPQRFLPSSLGGISLRDFLGHVQNRTGSNPMSRPVLLRFDNGVARSVVGSLTSVADQRGMPGAFILLLQEAGSVGASTTGPDGILGPEVRLAVDRMMGMFSLMARSVAVLEHEQTGGSVTVRNALGRLREETEKLQVLFDVLKDRRGA